MLSYAWEEMNLLLFFGILLQSTQRIWVRTAERPIRIIRGKQSSPENLARCVDLALKAVRSVAPVDAVVHLGDFRHDGQAMAEKLDIPVYLIRGDNDPWEGEKELVIECEGHKIYATHGHYHDVDSSTEKLIKAAKSSGADMALYGHNHRPDLQKKEGIQLVNPGSLFFVENERSFAYIEIFSDQIKAEIIRI